jgi:uncharacterized phage protein gp47/JayE
MSQIDSTGFSITSLADRLSALVTLMQNIFGTNVNVDPNSYDGQTLGIFAESINNLDQLAQAIYNCFNPNTAQGNALSTLVQLNYLTRGDGAFSTVPLTFTGAQGTPIANGSLFKSNDGSNNQWQTVGDAIIDATGAIIVQAQSTTFGAFTADIGVITIPLSPIYGLTGVTNAAAAIPGNIEETDEQLRARRALSTAANGQGPVDAIRGAIGQIPGVTQVEVYENNTGNPDDNGQAANSIYCVVQGGANQDIWNTIWFKRSAGVDIVGTVTGVVVDTAGFPHTMAFDRPTQTPIYIIANVKKRAGYPTNGTALIKAALVAWAQANLTIGQDVIQSELYNPLLSAVSMTCSISSLFIGFAANPTTTTDLSILYNAIAEFDPSFITVNES